MLAIVEIVAENLLDILQAITTGNGYPYTLNISRMTGRDNPQHLSVIIYQDDPHESPEETIAKVDYLQRFNCECWIMPPEGDNTPIDEYVNQIQASIRKCVMVNFRQTFDGISYAIDTKTLPHNIHRDAGGETIMTVPVEIYYRINYNDPFSQ